MTILLSAYNWQVLDVKKDKVLIIVENINDMQLQDHGERAQIGGKGASTGGERI